MSPGALYLDLLKKALSHALWPDVLVPVEIMQHHRSPGPRLMFGALAAVARRVNKQLMQVQTYSDEARRTGQVWPGAHAETMVGMARLDNVQFCVESVLADGIEGDLIEAGVWRGGVCILMRAILNLHGDPFRKVYVADSFQGLPEPDAATYPVDRQYQPFVRDLNAILAVSVEQVRRNFERYGLLDERVVFLPGWFKDTLPAAPIQKLAVMRLDGDFYSSTTETLDSLYPKLSPGGYCIVDDYGALEGCRRAVDDYRAAHGIEEELETIDWAGAFWRKAL